MPRKRKNQPVTFITCFNRDGYFKYGRDFIKSFLKYVDENIHLIVYCEDITPNIHANNITYKDLLTNNDVLHFCHHQMKNIPPDRIKYANNAIKDNKKLPYLFDAQKFCYKVFSYTDNELYHDKTGFLVWCDGDSVFQHYLTIDDFNAYFNNPPIALKDYICAYLGRIGFYSEGGFVVFNINSRKTKNFLKDMRDIYCSGNIFYEDEWHDSYILDVIRIRYENNNHKFWNITENINGINIWYKSWFARYCRHDIGLQKHKRYMKIINKNSYWRDVITWLSPKKIISFGSQDIESTVLISQFANKGKSKIKHHIIDYFDQTSSYDIDGRLQCLYTKDFFEKAVDKQIKHCKDNIDIVITACDKNSQLDNIINDIGDCDLYIINQEFNPQKIKEIIKLIYQKDNIMIAFNGVLTGEKEAIEDHCLTHKAMAIPQKIAINLKARFLPLPIEKTEKSAKIKPTIALFGQQQNMLPVRSL